MSWIRGLVGCAINFLLMSSMSIIASPLVAHLLFLELAVLRHELSIGVCYRGQWLVLACLSFLVILYFVISILALNS